MTASPEVVDAVQLDAGHDLHAHLLVGPLELLRHVAVLDGHEPVLHLDDGDLGAHVVVDVRELDADRARADDEQPLGALGLEHGLLVVDHLLAVDRERRDGARAGARGDDDVLGLERRLLPDVVAVHVRARLDGDLPAALERGRAP